MGLETMAENVTITARFETKIVQDFKSLTFAAIHFYSNKTEYISLMGLVLWVCVWTCVFRQAQQVS